MIQLTKLNKEPIILNCRQIESIEVMPESKIILTNGKFYIVEESTQVIVKKVTDYYALVLAQSKHFEKRMIDRNETEA